MPAIITLAPEKSLCRGPFPRSYLYGFFARNDHPCPKNGNIIVEIIISPYSHIYYVAYVAHFKSSFFSKARPFVLGVCITQSFSVLVIRYIHGLFKKYAK